MGESGRARYLAAAIETADGQVGRLGPADHLATSIRLSEIARRVGVSRTALYKLWPTRDELWADVVRYANYWFDYPRSAEQMGLPPDPDEYLLIDLATPEWAEATRKLTNGNVAAAAADPIWPLRAAALAYPESDADASARGAVESHRLGRLAERMSIGIRGGQREFVEPFGIRHMAEAAWAVMDGVMVAGHWLDGLSAAAVPADDGSGPRPWFLPAWMYRTMLYEWTRVGVPIDRFRPDEAMPEPPEWSARRRAVLVAGVEALLDILSSEHRDAALTILSHVTIERVARVAGVTRRAVYDVWTDRDTMVLDLLDELLATELEQIDAALAGLWPPGQPPSIDAARIGAALVPGHPTALDSAVSAYLPQSRHPEIRRRLAEYHGRKVGLLAAYFRRLDQPWEASTPDQVAEIVVALLSGLRRVRRVHGDTGWSGDLAVTCGVAVDSLCRHRPSHKR